MTSTRPAGAVLAFVTGVLLSLSACVAPAVDEDVVTTETVVAQDLAGPATAGTASPSDAQSRAADRQEKKDDEPDAKVTSAPEEPNDTGSKVDPSPSPKATEEVTPETPVTPSATPKPAAKPKPVTPVESKPEISPKPVAKPKPKPKPPAQPPAQPSIAASGITGQMLGQVNGVRAEAGLPALVRSACAESSAKTWAKISAENQQMAHQALGPVMTACGSNGAAENVAEGYANDGVFAGWMNSPGHRANILRAGPTSIGVAVATSAAGRNHHVMVLLF